MERPRAKTMMNGENEPHLLTLSIFCPNCLVTGLAVLSFAGALIAGLFYGFTLCLLLN